MNFTATDLAMCNGHGYYTGSVHRCNCLPGWIAPRCIWDMTSDEAMNAYDIWRDTTIVLLSVLIAIAVWRIIVLAVIKYRSMKYHPGIHLYPWWMKVPLVLDS